VKRNPVGVAVLGGLAGRLIVGALWLAIAVGRLIASRR
jgi:hypothetical protein